MFGLIRKRKEEPDMTQDEEQIKKAKEDIAEKGADSQTEKDRVDESVGEQEHLDGNKDSQSAKDRVDESEGAKKADEAREEDMPKWAGRMIESLDRIVSYFENKAKENPDAKAAEKLDAAFGAGEGVFQGEEGHEERKMTKEEIASLVHKIMR